MIIALCVINWTAISAVITAITALVAVIALWQNKQQIKEMRQQWLEDRRARLSFGIISNDGHFLAANNQCGEGNGIQYIHDVNWRSDRQTLLRSGKEFVCKVAKQDICHRGRG
ncbi:MAG: hypothetical protein L6V80_01355 [Bacteroidales bacterium]|nr:MAG: hypothetical protein L6V80_01355 [Bacteroidales bacterium]